MPNFTFPTIAFCSTLRIGPYLFYIEKFTTHFKTEKKMTGHRSRFRENDDLPLQQDPVIKKKPPFSNVRACKIMRSRDAQAILGNVLKLINMLLIVKHSIVGIV